MSTHRSYFDKNNTIYFNKLVNTGRNPVMDIVYGSNQDKKQKTEFSRFIFNIDLNPLFEKILNGTITTECVNNMTHILTMTNTIRFDDDLINSITSDKKLRSSSFDLILFRIPLTSGNTGDLQIWDEGIGYDATNPKYANNFSNGVLVSYQSLLDNNFSERPSNWFQTTTLDFWSENGLYNNKNEGHFVNYSALTIVDVQHFDKGNEDINFNMTDEINGIINGTITGVTGWGIAYRPEVELISGLTSNYSVSFFTRHTQTFYEPFLLTTYNDLIEDNRNLFVEKTTNKLFLYAYVDGNLVMLDNNPTVSILNPNGDPIPSMTGLSTCSRTKGIYEVIIPPMTGYKTPCQFTDSWSNIYYNGFQLPDIENEFTLESYKNRMVIGTQSREPEIFGFDFYGIKQDEKILNTDVRKVGVIIKKAYTTKQQLQNVDAFYRVYVREGNTEVQVQDWTKLNRSPNEYYFIFDTKDKIPNEYFIDIKVNTSGETDTYKRTIKFLIVNKK